VELERDPEGKRRQKWHTIHGTKKLAEQKLAELLHSLDTGSYLEPTDFTVATFLDRWLSEYAKRQVAGKTYERYASIVHHHLKPALGRFLLGKLQPLHLESAYTTWLETGRKKKQKEGPAGLSPRTVLQHHRILHKALKMAVRWRLISQNPADAVEPPTYQGREIQPLDEGGSAWLLEFANDGRLHGPILLAVAGGLRRGEILALRWVDVDLESAVIMVRRSIEQTKGVLKFKDTKGKRSRALPLPTLAIDALKAHSEHQDECRRLLGSAYCENGLVFPTEDGSIWRPDNFTSAFVTLAERAGLKGIRFHDLRHSHASQLLRHGVHPKVVQERLGHSSIAMTMDIYSHLLPGMQEEAAQKVDQALRTAIRKREQARPQ
jgi:integrase